MSYLTNEAQIKDRARNKDGKFKHTHRGVEDYKYAYFVNMTPESGRQTGTFSIIPKDRGLFQTGGAHHANSVTHKIYYTDIPVIFEKPESLLRHFEAVVKGTPNDKRYVVAAIPTDDAAMMEIARKMFDTASGNMTHHRSMMMIGAAGSHLKSINAGFTPDKTFRNML